MKNLVIDKNPQFLRLERSPKTCLQLLNGTTQEIRFDIVLEEDEKLTQLWRGKVSLVRDMPSLELKDYRDNHRTHKLLNNFDVVSDATNVALSIAWGMLESNKF